MFTWTCSCGDGAASQEASWDEARREGDLHVCRVGRLRGAHVVLVRESSTEA